MWFDKKQFRKDCWQILCTYGKRKQHGFFTIQEFEEGNFRIVSYPVFGIFYEGVPISSVKMGTPLAEFILNKIVSWEER